MKKSSMYDVALLVLGTSICGAIYCLLSPNTWLAIGSGVGFLLSVISMVYLLAKGYAAPEDFGSSCAFTFVSCIIFLVVVLVMIVML